MMDELLNYGIIGILTYAAFMILNYALKKDSKEISNQEIFEEVKKINTGYLKIEVLKSKMEYFVKQVQCRSQNKTEIIILKNNIDKNIEKTDKKIENIYFENEVEMNAMLYDLCSESIQNHIIDIFKSVNQENKNEVLAIIEKLKEEHTKEDEEKSIEELDVVMNKFEKRVIQAIKYVL